MKCLLCCALLVLGGCSSINRSPEGIAAERIWGPSHAGLRMAVWVTAADTERAAALQVHVGIENVGVSDVIVNLGFIGGSGDKMYPLAIGLVLTDSNGKVRQLQCIDPAVAGRVDDYLVALRAGSMYALRLAISEYWSPSSHEYQLTLAAGSYRIEARFTGREAGHINLDTEGIAGFNFWRGTLQSNVATLTLR